MSELDNFFNFTAEDVLAEGAKKTSNNFSEDMYRPNQKDSKDGIYRAALRFIPFLNAEGRPQSAIEKWEAYPKDINGQNGFYVDSLKNEKKSCPINDLYWKLKKSTNAADQENSKNLQVKQNWYSLVQVIKDPQHPDLNGKTLIFKYGKQIHDKIVEISTATEVADAQNPFGLFDAPYFELVINTNAAGYTNYTTSKFNPKSVAITFNDQTLENDADSRAAFIEWLKNEAPDINRFAYKPWTDEVRQKVMVNLATYTGGLKTTVANTAEAAPVDAAPRSVDAAAVEAVSSILDEPEDEGDAEVTDDIDAFLSTL